MICKGERRRIGYSDERHVHLVKSGVGYGCLLYLLQRSLLLLPLLLLTGLLFLLLLQLVRVFNLPQKLLIRLHAHHLLDLPSAHRQSDSQSGQHSRSHFKFQLCFLGVVLFEREGEHCVGLRLKLSTMILLRLLQSQNYSSLPAMLEMVRTWAMEVISPLSLNILVVVRLQAKNILILNPSG